MASLNIPFSVLTLNVQGLRKLKTRKALFRTFKLMKIDIICLQETYLLNSDKECIEKEWAGKFHLSEGTNQSKGLLTLFNVSLNSFDISEIWSNDRILISSVVIENETILISNCYSPSNSVACKSEFLSRLNDIMLSLYEDEEISSENVIILGDFNLSRNKELDIISGKPHAKVNIDEFNELILNLNVNDIYRIKNPFEKTFTWTRKKFNEKRVSRRLDYIFVSDSLVPFTTDVNIVNLGFSDHRAVVLKTDCSSFKKGPNIYKMNKNILKNQAFVDSVKIEIEKCKNLSNSLNPSLMWEYIKAQIRGLSISYSKQVCIDNAKTKELLLKKLSNLEKSISNGENSEILENELIKTKSELEVFTLAESRGAQLRAGLKFAELGEKSNKFFLNLEKSRAASNTIFRIRNNENTILTTNKDILEFLRSHFEKLYKNPLFNNAHELNDENNPFLNASNISVLTDHQKMDSGMKLSEEELLEALKLMKNDSSPGLDGLPIEVYKFFWSDLKDILISCYNFCFDSGSLSPSQSEALICLLHKGKGADREEVTSWRPIALLNSDYKLIAKVFALRLQKVIDEIIDSNQNAFIKGRGISSMLRELYDLIERERNRESSSILLSIDYSKAFDSISTKAILKAVKLHGFDEYFVRWIEILLANRKCCVRNAGFVSKSFFMERGVRQGCPISPLLFILTAELFAANVRADKNIKGISSPFCKRPVKIRMYADDFTFFLSNLVDYREILSKIKLFSVFSGLQINKNKSFAMSLGNRVQAGQYVEGIKFVSKLKILGVYFSSKEDARSIKENVLPKIENLKKVCATWYRRNLSLLGKITILKTFGISIFIIIIQSIGLLPKYINQINSILFRFIWKKKNDKTRAVERVSRKKICDKKHEGGLCMINMECFQLSFLLDWAERLLDNTQADWKACAMESLSRVGGKSAFKSNVTSKQFKGKNLIHNQFWREVLSAWLDHNDNSIDNQFSSESVLFNNKLIQFKKSILFFPECISRNILVIGDIINNGNIISFSNFRNKVNTPNSLLIYNCLFNALIPILHNYRQCSSDNNSRKSLEFVFCDQEVGKIGRKGFYNLLNKDEKSHVESYWSRELGHTFISYYWLIAFNATVETRLHMLHWKILMRIYPTAVLLSKMKISQSDNCASCQVKDTLQHFFFHCASVQEVWVKVVNLFNIITGKQFLLTWDQVTLGILPSAHVRPKTANKLNMIILLAKLAISKSKYGSGIKPAVIFENELNFRKIDISSDFNPRY